MLSLLYGPILTFMHDYWKNHNWLDSPLLIMSVLFHMLSRLVIAFLPRNKPLLISRQQSPSAVILEPKKKKKKSLSFHCFLIYLSWIDGTGCHDLSFLMLSFKIIFQSLSLSSKGSLAPFHFLLWRWSSAYLRVIDISPSNLDSSLCFIHPCVLHDVLSI